MTTYTDVSNAVIVNLQLAAQGAGGTYTQPPDFATIFPRMIEYAENRIYRKLVLLCERKTDATQTFTAGSRTLNLAAMAQTPLVVEGVAMITPAGTQPAAGTRWQFDPGSLDTIDATWPQESTTLAPNRSEERTWALKDNQTLVVKPTPDQNYVAEVTGVFQPPALNSTTNTTTYLTLIYPDLFIAACMIYGAAHQRDFGMSSDDPRMALSWEATYVTLEAGAAQEEKRRRGLAPFDGSTSRQIQSAPPPVPQGQSA